MKEVVVMLLVVTLGVLSAQSIPDLVDQISSYHEGNAFTSYSKFEFPYPDRGITREEMQSYNRCFGIRPGEPVGIRLPQYLDAITEIPAEHDYSQPSSLISVTSNPNERRASPAIF